MRRESHVRFCGGLGVKFPRATRRVMTLVQLGREVPELDADVFFTEMELRFLDGYAARVKLPKPSTLGAAILIVAVLGGYQNRTRDGPVGYQIMWRGLERLHLMTLGYEVRDEQLSACSHGNSSGFI